VFAAAPILGWAIGKDAEYLSAYFKRKGLENGVFVTDGFCDQMQCLQSPHSLETDRENSA